MQPFIPRRFEHIVFGFLLSCFMSFLISGVAIVLARGIAPGFVQSWLSAWLSSWAIAFPTVLVVAPLVRRMLRRLVLPEPLKATARPMHHKFTMPQGPVSHPTMSQAERGNTS